MSRSMGAYAGLCTATNSQGNFFTPLSDPSLFASVKPDVFGAGASSLIKHDLYGSNGASESGQGRAGMPPHMASFVATAFGPPNGHQDAMLEQISMAYMPSEAAAAAAMVQQAQAHPSSTHMMYTSMYHPTAVMSSGMHGMMAGASHPFHAQFHAPGLHAPGLHMVAGATSVNQSASTAAAIASAAADLEYDPRELEVFAEKFKQRRIKLGVTQADVGRALADLKIPGVGSLSQSTICRFESLTLSHNNMVALKPVLETWLDKAEKEAKREEYLLNEVGKKRKRTSIPAPEKRSLEAYFQVQPRPSGEKISQIADKLELKKSVVRVWFCNQRQKQKRMKFAQLPPGHSSENQNVKFSSIVANNL